MSIFKEPLICFETIKHHPEVLFFDESPSKLFQSRQLCCKYYKIIWKAFNSIWCRTRSRLKVWNRKMHKNVISIFMWISPQVFFYLIAASDRVHNDSLTTTSPLGTFFHITCRSQDSQDMNRKFLCLQMPDDDSEKCSMLHHFAKPSDLVSLNNGSLSMTKWGLMKNPELAHIAYMI